MPLQNDLLINMRKMAILGDAIRLQFSFWNMPSPLKNTKLPLFFLPSYPGSQKRYVFVQISGFDFI
jgi:hypothetical protein